MIDAIVFDLDGTLWDTNASCAVAWNRVLARHRIPFRTITEHDIRGVTGRPHDECIREVFAGLAEAHILTLAAETQTEDNRVVAELGGELFADVHARRSFSGRRSAAAFATSSAGAIPGCPRPRTSAW